MKLKFFIVYNITQVTLAPFLVEYITGPIQHFLLVAEILNLAVFIFNKRISGFW